MRQRTNFFQFDIGGVTNEFSLIPNYVDTMIKIDSILHNLNDSQDTDEDTIQSLQQRVTVIENALAKTGQRITVNGISNAVLTAGGYVAQMNPEEEGSDDANNIES